MDSSRSLSSRLSTTSPANTGTPATSWFARATCPPSTERWVCRVPATEVVPSRPRTSPYRSRYDLAVTRGPASGAAGATSGAPLDERTSATEPSLSRSTCTATGESARNRPRSSRPRGALGEEGAAMAVRGAATTTSTDAAQSRAAREREIIKVRSRGGDQRYPADWGDHPGTAEVAAFRLPRRRSRPPAHRDVRARRSLVTLRVGSDPSGGAHRRLPAEDQVHGQP